MEYELTAHDYDIRYSGTWVGGTISNKPCVLQINEVLGEEHFDEDSDEIHQGDIGLHGRLYYSSSSQKYHTEAVDTERFVLEPPAYRMYNTGSLAVYLSRIQTKQWRHTLTSRNSMVTVVGKDVLDLRGIEAPILEQDISLMVDILHPLPLSTFSGAVHELMDDKGSISRAFSEDFAVCKDDVAKSLIVNYRGHSVGYVTKDLQVSLVHPQFAEMLESCGVTVKEAA